MAVSQPGRQPGGCGQHHRLIDLLIDWNQFNEYKLIFQTISTVNVFHGKKAKCWWKIV